MRKVFVDTAYWIAIANPNGPWNKAAGEAHGRLGEVKLVTTQEVLGEFLTFLSKPQALRRAAVKMVENILKHPGLMSYRNLWNLLKKDLSFMRTGRTRNTVCKIAFP